MIIDCGAYRDGNRLRECRDATSALATLRHSPGANGFVWLGLFEPSDAELADAGTAFHLSPGLVHHLRGNHMRPAVVEADGWTVLVLRTARYDEPNSEVEFGEIVALLRADALIVARHGHASELAPARHYFDGHPGVARNGAPAALHTVVAHVIDEYSTVLDGIDEDIDEVEQLVFSETPVMTTDPEGPTARIYYLKREAIEVSRALGAMVEPLDRMADDEVAHISDPVCDQLRQVHEAALRLRDHALNQRELLTSVLEANLTQVSIRQNEDMRRISAWAAILAVPTLIAGIYGMNFRHMPELEAKIGYPIALLGMLGVCTFLYRLFRRSGWL